MGVDPHPNSSVVVLGWLSTPAFATSDAGDVQTHQAHGARIRSHGRLFVRCPRLRKLLSRLVRFLVALAEAIRAHKSLTGRAGWKTCVSANSADRNMVFRRTPRLLRDPQGSPARIAAHPEAARAAAAV